MVIFVSVSEKYLPPYSVLMSVYEGEKAEYLKISLDSMLSQSHRTDNFVLICDGKLTEELDRVIQEYEEQYPDIFCV